VYSQSRRLGSSGTKELRMMFGSRREGACEQGREGRDAESRVVEEGKSQAVQVVRSMDLREARYASKREFAKNR